MKLKKIKLSGFKSFVEPTTIPISANLSGIVGPNGCGKSNVIDAVRWVMGESSAKQLRGDSSVDVIFNGSSDRKPVGQAMVELIFDNSDKTVLGAYAAYNEISIKRTVNRDAQSVYYINSSRARRRDVHDIFLGTGLGPRSYAIIEQGMISRFIEAKPEEIRTYIEEAAGISKYKERRRETENRITHTKENLERLHDIMHELEKQLAKLDKQADNAKIYRELRRDENTLSVELAALKCRNYDKKAKIIVDKIKNLSSEIEKLELETQKLTSQESVLKTQESEVDNEFKKEQANFYQISGEISKYEQELGYKTQEISEAKNKIESLSSEQNNKKEKIIKLEQDKNNAIKIEQEIRPKIERSAEYFQKAQEVLKSCDEKLRSAENKLNLINAESLEMHKRSENLKAQIDKRDDLLEHNHDRYHALQEDHEELTNKSSDKNIESLKSKLIETNNILCQENKNLSNLQINIKSEYNQRDSLQYKITEEKGLQQKIMAKLESLKTLQNHILNKNNQEKYKAWVNKNIDGTIKYIAENITVKDGFETAVEHVLGDYLTAVGVDNLDKVVNKLDADLKQHNCVFLNLNEQAVKYHPDSLASKVQGPDIIKNLLANIMCAQDLLDVKNRLKTLDKAHSVVTPDGVWLSHDKLSIAGNSDQEHGFLERKNEIKALKDKSESQQNNILNLEKELEDIKNSLESNNKNKQELRNKTTELQNNYNKINHEINSEQKNIENITTRLERIESEKNTLQQKNSEYKTEIIKYRQELEGLIEKIADNSKIKAESESHKESFLIKYHDLKNNYEKARNEHHSLAIEEQRVKNNIINFTKDYDYAVADSTRITKDLNINKDKINNLEKPIELLQKNIQVLLTKRDNQDKVLKKIRGRFNNIQQEVRNIAENINNLGSNKNKVTEQVQENKIGLNTIEVKKNSLLEEFQQVLDKVKEADSRLAEDSSINQWESELNKIKNKIKRLGAVNLAAIEEFKEESERKKYLQEQIDDLEKSLAILDTAIKKIDKETKSRFQETFDEVNKNFKTLFPQVFEGGRAVLELTSDDLLDSGIKIIAQPPGKKNTSIHLLSGGEKALTAISLVFSIFQINPAPFCILDEVDAPLDDANVGRFCRIVKSMSQNVQFMFITHNKITMEMADKLMGVTMNEPGVSRIVAVDVEKAEELAEA